VVDYGNNVRNLNCWEVVVVVVVFVVEILALGVES